MVSEASRDIVIAHAFFDDAILLSWRCYDDGTSWRIAHGTMYT